MPVKPFHPALLVALAVLGLTAAAEQPAGIPADYQLLYQQDFENPQALHDFVMTDPAAWKIGRHEKGAALELARQSKYQPPVRSPLNIALIADKLFGDFILEADLMQTGREYGHRDMCLFFGLQDPAHFYYTHLATKADDHAHNIFIVDDLPRTKIASQTTEGVDWGLNVWHKVRLERKASRITVCFDDFAKPIMLAENAAFKNGAIGFGSFDDTGMIDNIRIWGPSCQNRKTEFYSRP